VRVLVKVHFYFRRKGTIIFAHMQINLHFCANKTEKGPKAAPKRVSDSIPEQIAVPETEADGLGAAAQENAQGRKDYPTHARARKWVIRYARRMCAYMGNTVYAIRCVCLCILCSGGHTRFVSLFIQNKRP